MPLIVRALLLALGLMLCARAEAACTVSATSSTQFGSQTSYAVRAGTVTATTTSTNNFILQSGGAQIPYRLYADPNGSIIRAPDISFGNAPLASQFAAVSQAVLTDCTLGTPYDVAFDDGQNRLAGSWRRMRSGSDFLEYNIYRPDGTTIWDLANPLPAGPGTGETTPGRIQNYVARINPAQQTPPAGLYADTVSVVITF